jgi:hypothetical protein
MQTTRNFDAMTCMFQMLLRKELSFGRLLVALQSTPTGGAKVPIPSPKIAFVLFIRQAENGRLTIAP